MLSNNKLIICVLLFCMCLTKVHANTGYSSLCEREQDDKTQIDCELDVGTFAAQIPESKEDLTVVSYNVDRNGYGESSEPGRLENIIELLKSQLDQELTDSPDVILLQELARDCYNYGKFQNGIQDIARELNMYFAYVVEYTNLEHYANGDQTHQCTIGNGILSKYPIENIVSYRYQNQCCKLGAREGGRVSLIADIKISEEKSIRVNNVHLEAGTAEEFAKAMVTRFKQVQEITKYMDQDKSIQTIIGGDFNSPLNYIDPTIILLKYGNGYEDTHSSMSYFDRNTCPEDVLAKLGLWTYDYFFQRNGQVLKSGICNTLRCHQASDHLPIWTSIKIITKEETSDSKEPNEQKLREAQKTEPIKQVDCLANKEATETQNKKVTLYKQRTSELFPLGFFQERKVKDIFYFVKSLFRTRIT